MARKNLIESSDNFNEIVARLSRGDSGAGVSEWLHDEKNEDISPRTLNRWRNKNIKMEDRVEAELNKRQEIKNKNKNKTEKHVQEKADKIEEAENTMSVVASTIADNMEGVAKVAAELPDIFERAKRDAQNSKKKTEWKDVAKISIQANKIYNDYFKHEESNIEININEGFEELADAIKKSREACKKD
ncbi:MAG: hypothetical protein K6A34_06190 [Methanobrevibacter sp.]|nr:hypothetical protein [Methanobrevibacter sp.]